MISVARILVLGLAMIVVWGCRRRPAETPTAVAPKEVEKTKGKGPPTTVEGLIEKFKTERKPPPSTATDVLQVYDDNPIAGDHVYKGQYVWLTGSLKKLDSKYNKPFLVLGDGLKRPIAIQAEFVPPDFPMLAVIRRDEPVTIWGRVRGMSNGNVLIDNCILLTRERQDTIAKSKKDS